MPRWGWGRHEMGDVGLALVNADGPAEPEEPDVVPEDEDFFWVPAGFT